MIPQQTDELISGFVEESKRILQGSLAGIYLHGSAVMGCFHPQRSDIDLIIVVKEPLSDAVKREYMDMVADYNCRGPAKGIEMSIVLKDVCNPFIYPTPFELHFSEGHLKRYRDDPERYIREMKGTDKDLAAHFTIINKRGRCLYGEPVRDIFAEVPDRDYMDSIYSDIAGAVEEIGDHTMYLTLNLARVLAYKKEGLVLSKEEGGEWAVKNLPPEYHPLVKAAMREYAGGTGIVYHEIQARRYAAYMIKLIKQ